MEVGLGPGDIVLDGDPALLSKKHKSVKKIIWSGADLHYRTQRPCFLP